MSTFATLINGFQNGIAKDFKLSIPKALVNVASQRHKYTIVILKCKNKSGGFFLETKKDASYSLTSPS